MSQNIEYRTKLLILSAALGILTLTAVLGWTFSQQAVTQRQSQEPLLAGLASAGITGIEVGDIVLTKDSAWKLSYQGHAYPASSDRVETYLKTLASLLRERLVTRDGGQAFGLEKDFKTLKLLKQGVVYELQVGGTNEQGDKAYVRLAGQKEIWQTDRGFARTLDLDFNTWADLTLFPGRKDTDLTRIAFDSRIETSDKTVYSPFDLVKKTADGKTVWEDRISKAAAEPMASWAALVPHFRFGAFADPSQPATGASLGTLTATWSDGTTSVVKIGAADAKNRYRASEGGRDFWIDDWALGQLLYK